MIGIVISSDRSRKKKHIDTVHFRFIEMPCCKHQLCWVNPRLPTYCPECGANILAKVKEGVLIDSAQSFLSYYT